MHYVKEIVNEPKLFDKRHLSSAIINSPTFAATRIKQGGYGILDTDFWLERVSHRGFHVFVLTLSGKGNFTLEDGTKLTVRQGDAFVSWSKGQGHHECTTGPEPWEMIWLTIWDDSPRFTPDADDWEIIRFSGIDLLRTLFQSIMEEEMYSDARSMLAMDLYEQLFLIQMERSLGWTESVTTRYNRTRLVPLWETVTNRISEPWYVPELCKEAGIGRSHLNRICQALYHQSPGDVVRTLKMEQAEVLLCNTTLSISDVAEHIGYLNPGNFSTAFTSFTGETPRSYREHRSPKPRTEHLS